MRLQHLVESENARLGRLPNVRLEMDETKLSMKHRGYLLKAIALGAFITALGYTALFGLAVLLKVVFE